LAGADSFYTQLMQMRAAHPQDSGLELSAIVGKRSDKQRANVFAVPARAKRG
jgi:hypothetical protein